MRAKLNKKTQAKMLRFLYSKTLVLPSSYYLFKASDNNSRFIRAIFSKEIPFGHCT